MESILECKVWTHWKLISYIICWLKQCWCKKDYMSIITTNQIINKILTICCHSSTNKNTLGVNTVTKPNNSYLWIIIFITNCQVYAIREYNFSCFNKFLWSFPLFWLRSLNFSDKCLALSKKCPNLCNSFLNLNFESCLNSVIDFWSPAIAKF